MELRKRWSSKTPKFWKKVQKIGIVVGAIGTVILTAPISLPVGLVSVGGYLVTAGGITAAISQLTIE
jgi:ABC-type protease/lipase transport system fused ATPase/permease subunit